MIIIEDKQEYFLVTLFIFLVDGGLFKLPLFNFYLFFSIIVFNDHLNTSRFHCEPTN